MKLNGLIVLAASAALAGCATAPPRQLASACPMGQEAHRTAQLYFGRNAADRAAVSEAAFHRFVDQELTPKFPDGLTVMDGGGRWRGDENRLIREASKVVTVVLPKGRDSSPRIEAVRSAYRSRFHQDSVLLLNQPACISF